MVHRYWICQQMSRLRQSFKNNSRNKAATRTANKKVLNCARMDVLSHRILPVVNLRSQQEEVAPVGTATPQSVI